MTIRVPALPMLLVAVISAASALAAPAARGNQAPPQLPHRVETAHALLLGDEAADDELLERYADAFETGIVPEVERDTGLRPREKRAPIIVYGTEAAWQADPAVVEMLRGSGGGLWGFYAPRQGSLYMAHWRIEQSRRDPRFLDVPEINTVLLAHEYFHWLADAEGKARRMPLWLNEGLAFAISWRIIDGAAEWSPPFPTMTQWWSKTDPGRVLNLAGVVRNYSDQDVSYFATSVGHLMESRGREAFVRFFALSREGKRFSEAFESAFGVNEAAFQLEYEQRVAEVHAGAP